MRTIIEAATPVVAVIIAATFIWLVLSAPGFTADDASTGPLATHRVVRR